MCRSSAELFLNGTITGQRLCPVYANLLYKGAIFKRLHAVWKKKRRPYYYCGEQVMLHLLPQGLMHEENFIKKYEVSIIRLDFYSMRWVYY